MTRLEFIGEQTETRMHRRYVNERKRTKYLKPELKELRPAYDILRKASSYFAQAEIDRPRKYW